MGWDIIWPFIIFAFFIIIAAFTVCLWNALLDIWQGNASGDCKAYFLHFTDLFDAFYNALLKMHFMLYITCKWNIGLSFKKFLIIHYLMPFGDVWEAVYDRNVQSDWDCNENKLTIRIGVRGIHLICFGKIADSINY